LAAGQIMPYCAHGAQEADVTEREGSEVGDRDMVGGLQNGLAVIEAFDERRPRLTIADVARATGLTRAAARRYLLTLARLGYADHDGKFFSLTPKVLRLGYAALSAMTLPSRVQPWLERISAEVGESSSAAVLDDDEVVYIARSATRRIMSIGLGVGSRLPAYCTSLGRVLLAAQDEAWLDAYFARVALGALTPRTLTSALDIRTVLDDVRRAGHCIVDEELELGLRSVAVPVRDGSGQVRCAINVGVQTHRMTVQRMRDELLPRLRAAAGELSRIL
jgi:IclR family pca regulon transcriptional regulator